LIAGEVTLDAMIEEAALIANVSAAMYLPWVQLGKVVYGNHLSSAPRGG
jgi:hypothetical protein